MCVCFTGDNVSICIARLSLLAQQKEGGGGGGGEGGQIRKMEGTAGFL